MESSRIGITIDEWEEIYKDTIQGAENIIKQCQTNLKEDIKNNKQYYAWKENVTWLKYESRIKTLQLIDYAIKERIRLKKELYK